MALSLDQEYVTQSVRHWKVREIQSYQRQSCHFFVLFTTQRLLTTTLQASFAGISRNLSTDHETTDTFLEIAIAMGCATMIGTVLWEVVSCVQLHISLRKRVCQILQ